MAKIKPARIFSRSTEPFFLTPDDPGIIKVNRRKLSQKGNSRKYLTKVNMRSIIKSVNKLKRKDDKMAYDKNKKSNNRNALLSVAWLVEVAFRAFTGWVLLSNFDNIATTAAAFYALGTAGIIVVTHFVKAYK